MATVNNSELVQELVKGGRLASSEVAVPQIDTRTIIPVMEVNPALLRRSLIIRQAARVISGTGTIYTTPTNQDFYLVAVQVGWSCDAANDSTNAVMNVTVNGATRYIVYIPKITLTAIQSIVAFSLPFPLKIDRNTNIQIGSTFAAGNSNITGTVIGYVDEQSLA